MNVRICQGWKVLEALELSRIHQDLPEGESKHRRALTDAESDIDMKPSAVKTTRFLES